MMRCLICGESIGGGIYCADCRDEIDLVLLSKQVWAFKNLLAKLNRKDLIERGEVGAKQKGQVHRGDAREDR